MGHTLAEKIFANASGRDSVAADEVVWAKADLVTAPEVSFPAYVKRLRGIGIDRLAHPERVVVAIDHEAPVHSAAGAERNRQTRQMAAELGVANFFDSEGITHPLVVERGLVRPGMFVAAADSHGAVVGGTGAVGIPFGFETSLILATGQTWIKVPRTIKVTLAGRLQPGVGARDIALATMSRLSTAEASYRVLEFHGAAIAGLSVWERMTICGLCIDIGAKSAVVPADEHCVAFLEALGVSGAVAMTSDADAVFEREIVVDLDTLAPQVSVPPSPIHVRSVSDIAGLALDYAYLGSCASGTMQDLRSAADLLDGRKVHPGTQMLVIPATRRVFLQAMSEGVLNRLAAAGAQVSPPTCGPCFGGIAQLCAGERRISTSTRNDPGRMGSNQAEIYLASALTVTASAIAGRIADPRELLGGGT
ncbi:MAG: 3-isopropylmalate dehydratase large subunit [Rhodospirillales bacterium]|nr:3-isopropylmalate dehydratase large subunit [Rhodospirillales bacterium]